MSSPCPQICPLLPKICPPLSKFVPKICPKHRLLSIPLKNLFHFKNISPSLQKLWHSPQKVCHPNSAPTKICIALKVPSPRFVLTICLARTKEKKTFSRFRQFLPKLLCLDFDSWGFELSWLISYQWRNWNTVNCHFHFYSTSLTLGTVLQCCIIKSGANLHSMSSQRLSSRRSGSLAWSFHTRRDYYSIKVETSFLRVSSARISVGLLAQKAEWPRAMWMVCFQLPTHLS